MPQFTTTHRVLHSAQNMYDLVADIERYPEFVPLCDGLTIKSQEQQGDKNIILADMTVAYKLMRETFTSKVHMNPDKQEIITEAVQGPFRNMRNSWKFKDVDSGGCDVEFTISYEFRNFALQLLMGGLFEKVFRKFSSAFEARADKVYGVPAREI